MRIGLICGEAAGARVLQALASGAHEVAALLASPATPLWSLAGRLGYRPIPAQRVREPGFDTELARAGVDLLLNVHSLYLVPEAVLRVPALGAYNLHSGPLPRYAGLNAPSWAIYHGEERHGVTVHRMEPGVDTGPIAFQECFPIERDDTGLALSSAACRKASCCCAACSARWRPGGCRSRPRTRRSAATSDAAPRKTGASTGRRRRGASTPSCGPATTTRFPRLGARRARLGEGEVEVLKTALTGEPSDAAPGTVCADAPHGPRVATADEWLELRRINPALCRR